MIFGILSPCRYDIFLACTYHHLYYYDNTIFLFSSTMGVFKYPHQCYIKTAKASVHTPWQHHRKCASIIQTPLEKAAIKAKNHERKVAYADALSRAQDIVMQEAIKLQEQFGSCTIEYYFKAILQTSHLIKKRGPSQWNVYLRQEIKKHNSSECTFLMVIIEPLINC